jgi:lipoate-protein ligase A
MDTWRHIRISSSNAFRNMAVDEALLECFERSSSSPILRFYMWNPPGLSLGYFQKSGEVDLDACRKEGVDLVRRPTGGRAILHDREITYSVVMPVADGISTEISVLESFKKINDALCRGLNMAGIPALLVPREKRTDPAHPGNRKKAACFSSPSWYELQVDGRKILGSAQTRKKGVLLQHGSFLMSLDREKLFRLFRFPSDEKRAEALSESLCKMTSAEEILGCVPGSETVCTALRKGFEQEYGVELVSSTLTEREEGAACLLEREKYRTDAWNFRR